jgi:hypothetical protein
MSRANPLWGAPRIHGELLKLGFEVAQSTVARYMCKLPSLRLASTTLLGHRTLPRKTHAQEKPSSLFGGFPDGPCCISSAELLARKRPWRASGRHAGIAHCLERGSAGQRRQARPDAGSMRRFGKLMGGARCG